jgi:hypothetical protein
MAVGVAKINAQGQNTTKIVTARMISPVYTKVKTAQINAITTMKVAHLSAALTTFAFSGLADSTILINL